MDENQERKIMYGLLVLLIAAIIATAVIFYKPVEPYTTLYFTEPLKLKTEVSVNEPFYVKFTVENHEKELCNYSYLIELLYYDNQTLVKTTDVVIEEIILNDNETASISEKIVIGEPYDDRIKVSVQLYKERVNEPYRHIYKWIKVE